MKRESNIQNGRVRIDVDSVIKRQRVNEKEVNGEKREVIDEILKIFYVIYRRLSSSLCFLLCFNL